MRTLVTNSYIARPLYPITILPRFEHPEGHFNHDEERAKKIINSFVAGLGLATAIASLAAHADTSQDSAITNQVKNALTQHPDVGTDIEVMTKNGVVYLKGNTSTPLAKTHAEELAKAIPGVQKVVDDIGTEK